MATYDYLKSKNGHKIQVESAKRDGAGKNIENNYAKQNGYYAQLTAGLADNFTPYSEDSGDLQENPFISNGTGTNNNQEIVTVGDYALVQAKQGNSVVVNQLMSNDRASGSSDSVTYTNNGDGTFTLNGTATGANFVMNLSTVDTKWISGHKYLVLVNGFENTNAKCMLNQHGATTQVSKVVDTSTSGLTTNSSLYPRVYIANGDAVSNIKVSIKVVDLTQWGFTADEIADITANPSHFSWYYNGSLAYNTGSLESANGRYLVSTGRNLWDEQWENGAIGSGGGNTSSSSIRSKNFCIAIPNTTYYSNKYLRMCYYDKNQNFLYRDNNATLTHITPPNCCYFKITLSDVYGTPYNYDITISLYYTPEQGGEGYDKYYPYEEPTIVDTGTEPLLAFDTKDANGTVHRNTLDIDTSSSSVTFNTSGSPLISISINNTQTVAKPTINNDSKGNVICSKYVNAPRTNLPSNCICINASGVVVINDSNITSDMTDAQIRTYLNGLHIFVEKKDADKTTEQGTPFAGTLPINDYGMLYWLDENDNLVGIPQGVKIFFPVNYKGFLDDIYSRTSGDAENLVVQSELSASESARDTIDTQLQNAIGGTLRQCLCVKESLDFDNTAVVDLGTLNFSRANNSGAWNNYLFYAQIPTMKNQSKALSTVYKTQNVGNVATTSDKTLYLLTTNNYIYICDNAYTDATTFKAAMKGVLLAYEKA